MPGHELSGVVSELGYGTTGLTVGQRVFGLADWARDGSLAEYTAVEARNLAPLPADIDYTVAAAVPISWLTAWQGLFGHAGLKTGQTVLVHGPLVRAGGTLVTIIGLPKVRPADGRAIFFVVERTGSSWRTSPSGCGPGGCIRSSGPYGRWPRQRPRSRPTAGSPARRSSASPKANNGRRVSDRSADRSQATCPDR